MAKAPTVHSLSPFAAGRTDLHGDHTRDIYREAGLQDWTLHYTYRGLGRISGRQQNYYSPVGDVLLHKPRIVSDYGIEDSHKEWTHLWATFQMPNEWFSLLTWPEILPGIYCLHIEDLEMRSLIERMLFDMIALFKGPQLNRIGICTSILHSILLCCDSINTQSNHKRLDPRIQVSMRFMHRHLDHALQVQQLADSAQLSISRYAHLFREQTGLAPLQYLERERMQRACNDLIMSAKPIAEIAEDVGIQDPAYFTRLFRRHTGTTPRNFRKRNINNQGSSSD